MYGFVSFHSRAGLLILKHHYHDPVGIEDVSEHPSVNKAKLRSAITNINMLYCTVS